MNTQTIKSSIWCGILIIIGGLAYLTIGGPLFILCGLPHCVADIFYYFVSEIQNGWSYDWLILWLVSVGGNFIGCNIPQMLKSCPEG